MDTLFLIMMISGNLFIACMAFLEGRKIGRKDAEPELEEQRKYIKQLEQRCWIAMKDRC